MKHITLAVACLALLAAPAWGDWAEDFQSYTLGTSIDGQGGWAGWDGAPFPAPNALVDNDPAAVAGNQVLHEIANNDMVQQFSGYTSGAWTFRAMQYIPSSQQGLAAGTSFILMNNYNVGGDKGWGSQLNFDLANNVVKDAEANEGNVPIVYDAWTEIRVEIDLNANVRTTFYNGTAVGSAGWYNPADATQAKSVAAVDLWADAGGDPVYYDDLSLTSAGAGVQGIDLTTNGSVVSRYLVNLGQAYGDTVAVGSPNPTGLYEIVNSGGNQGAWWQLNDGNHDNHAEYMVTYMGTPPDYIGFRFKMPATVNAIVWWNDPWWCDGGTFAAAPEVQYLDAMDGTWQTHADVTWNRPYDNAYTCDTDPNARAYIVTLNNPPANIWGIRLIGDTQPGADDITFDANLAGTPGTGFLAGPEMTVYGSIDVSPLDLANNLALTSNGGMPIANHWHYGTKPDFPQIARVNDGDFTPGNSNDTWGVSDPEDYIGITWPTPQDNVAAVGMVFAGFRDGGYFGAWGTPTCPDNVATPLRVEYTTDGTTWTPVTGLNMGRYPEDAAKLQLLDWGPDTGFLFRFNAVSGITGIRLIGPPAGYVAADNNGFVGVLEFEVFANSGGGASPAPQSALPSSPSWKTLLEKAVQKLRAAVQS